MKHRHEKPVERRVSEPVQVYLKPADQDRLERLTEELGTSKSDVLRRGLRALEQQLTDPNDHPALRIIGLGASTAGEAEEEIDAAREHDRLLAESEMAGWNVPGVSGARDASEAPDASAAPSDG